jgi:phosphopantetheinyl transferase
LALYAGVRLDGDLKIGPFGRPELAQGSPSVSLSHSGDYAALALFGRTVGADVEEVRPRSSLLAGRVLAPDEKRELEREGGSPAALIALWTRKESLGKADGRGLELAEPVSVLSDSVRLGGRPYRLWTGLLPGAVLSVAAEAEKSGLEASSGLKAPAPPLGAPEAPAVARAERRLIGFLKRWLETGLG